MTISVAIGSTASPIAVAVTSAHATTNWTGVNTVCADITGS